MLSLIKLACKVTVLYQQNVEPNPVLMQPTEKVEHFNNGAYQ